MNHPPSPLLSLSDHLASRLDSLSFGPSVKAVYNPLVYAREPLSLYLERQGRGSKEAVFLGMNPGPWGMAQTGVPFGAVDFVRDFLNVSGKVGAPPQLLPSRPVTGFACTRKEVSGTRVWGWVRDRFGSADSFAARFFIANYCPLLFYGEGGVNLTPDKLPKDSRRILHEACDEALRGTLQILEARTVLAFGRYASDRAEEALAGLGIRVEVLPHPSPANPAANRGWEALMDQRMEELGM